MVAAGVPEHNEHHASDISKMSLDLLSKVNNNIRRIFKV